MIFDNSQPEYSVLDLGYNKSLTKNLLSSNLIETTPELSNVFTSGVAPKNLIAGELIEFLDTGQAGISGIGTLGTDIRIWAGATFEDRASAPFRVDQDGNVTGTTITLTNAILTNVTIDGGTITNITNITLVGGASVVEAAGSTGQIQFNTSDAFDASSLLTFSPTGGGGKNAVMTINEIFRIGDSAGGLAELTTISA